MHLEEALQRIQKIVEEIETNQLPLHEVMKLHEEGQKLVSHSEKILGEARERLQLTTLEIEGNETKNAVEHKNEELHSDDGEIDLF